MGARRGGGRPAEARVNGLVAGGDDEDGDDDGDDQEDEEVDGFQGDGVEGGEVAVMVGIRRVG